MKTNKLRVAKIFLSARTPLTVYVKYLLTKLASKNRAKFAEKQFSFQRILAGKINSVDWFTNQIPYWHAAFNELGISADDQLNVLEIGSFEGASSLFFVNTFPNCRLTCVDTWLGADEHENVNMKLVEANFDSNMAENISRVTKFKGTSFRYFLENDRSNSDLFDLIYVDGSHFFDDVLIDALKSFERLKVGGVIIFDDYLWAAYDDYSLNPAHAINQFYRSKSKYLRIIAVYHQLIVQKIGDHDKTTGLVSLSS